MTINTIERLQRAIFAQLSPLTGVRATATATVTAEAGGGDVTLPPNTYLAPVIGGELFPGWLFKVRPNPATVTGDVVNGIWEGGEWTIPDGGSLVVDLVANVGGSQTNLRVGTVLRFQPEVPGLDPLAALATAGVGGVGGGLVKRMMIWELFNGPDAAMQYFQAGSGEFPALMLCWQSSSPLEGRTSGGNQGATRRGRFDRAFQETFVLYIAAGSMKSAHARRNQGELAMLLASELITDRRLNIDCEALTSQGAGVEITNRRIVTANRAMYIYQLEFICNSIVTNAGKGSVSERVYPAFAQASVTMAVDGREAPEPTEPLDLVSDVIITL